MCGILKVVWFEIVNVSNWSTTLKIKKRLKVAIAV
jgi:hypothetical protein